MIELGRMFQLCSMYDKAQRLLDAANTSIAAASDACVCRDARDTSITFASCNTENTKKRA